MSRSPHNDEYVRRVNLVIDYIYANLADDLTLERLASVAGFSPFHFHRIFKLLVDETLSQFVWRARVERGALLLRTRPQLPVSDVAAVCGFGSLVAFSRAFKQRFGLPPTRWIPHQPEPVRLEQRTGCPAEFPVTIRQLPPQRLAYVRVFDSYSDYARIVEAYHRLVAWYCSKGGEPGDTALYGMSHDDPDITPLPLCRFDWCVSVPAGWTSNGDVAIRDFPACDVAAVSMTGDIHLEEQVLYYLWGCWLPSSVYQPADLPAMEIYRRWPDASGTDETFHLDCAVPIIPLGA
ncbi:MAG: GyrI-like domain-containing protein [Anaerolineae bacterium]